MGGPQANGISGGGAPAPAQPGLRATIAGLNHNVLLTAIAKGLSGVASGIWAMSTIATYLFMIEDNSNTAVGIAQGVLGVFGAVSGVPAGYIADHTRRDRTLHGFGVVQIAAVVTTSVALLLPVREVALGGRMVDSQYLIILGSMVLWGISLGSTPVMDAILADSVKSGSRTGLYTVLYAITILAVAVGQFIAAGVFLLSGNRWTVHSLKVVMLIGQAVSLAPAVVLFLFDDDKALGEESDPLTSRPPSMLRLGAAEEGGEAAAGRPARGWGDISFVLPFVLTTAGGLFGIAAGMTVKFFPIFFKEAVVLSPGATNLVMAVTPLALACTSFFAQAVSVVLGRIQTVIAFQSLGVSLLFVMGLFPSIWTVRWVILPVYILRTMANNCCYAIIRSLLMDYVPKETRGRWNSTDNVMQLGWSGSAVLGGFLLDRYSFDGTFLITASVQAFAWSLQLPLLAILPAHEAHHADAVVQTDAERQLAVEGAVEGTVAAASPLVGEDGLTTPLLQSPALDDGETEKQ